MEPLNPILGITVTINQLQRDFTRKERNYQEFTRKWGQRNYRNKPGIKRNYKFYRYYCLQAIQQLKDYRDLLCKIHARKEELLQELEGDENEPIECSAETA